MGASCKDQKKALAICLQRSPCVLIERNTPKDCLMDPELKKDLPELCLANFRAFMDCKNGVFDMRRRMRGNAPLSNGKYDEIYDNLSSGNYNPREEIKKLEIMNKNLSKQRQLQLQQQEEAKRLANLESGDL
ncbi:cytochrome c oxidase assembly protein PET191-domain-containing protein [Scheffersomyces coipomensis]|uniref:cytochrome c oxidase assembly protein PET191-domain-containing protein n=1 Tax=Scheffersomyces coipomensis TaxID=1788519 RepID=UPI00315C9BA9